MMPIRSSIHCGAQKVRLDSQEVNTPLRKPRVAQVPCCLDATIWWKGFIPSVCVEREGEGMKMREGGERREGGGEGGRRERGWREGGREGRREGGREGENGKEGGRDEGRDGGREGGGGGRRREWKVSEEGVR